MTKLIPSFDFYKTLDGSMSFDFQRLEKSYHEYDSSHAHRHNYFEILFFNNSGGEHEIDFKVVPVTAHAVHLIAPEQIHILRRKRNVTGYVLAFSKDLFINMVQNNDFIETLLFFQLMPSAPVIKLSNTATGQLIDIISQIEKEFVGSHEHKKEMLALLVCQLLLYLKRHNGSEHLQTNINRVTLGFRKLVKEHFRQISSVSQYARMLFITAGHLNDTIKKTTGKTAKEIIDEQKILEAKRLLFHSKQTIKEIAFDLNFEEPSYFNRFFHKHTGLTPLAFRNSTREKYH